MSVGADTPLPVLWGARTGNCLRAAIGLLEARIPFTTQRVELRQGEQRSPQFLTLNPLGKTPVLTGLTFEGRPFSLTQSNAILFFADEVTPGILIPRTGQARVLAIERFFYFITDVIGLAFAASTLIRHRQRDAADLLTKRSIEAIAESERFLMEGPFIAGDTFSIADIAAYTIIKGSANHLPWNELPRLEAWMAHIGARSAVAHGWAIFDR